MLGDILRAMGTAVNLVMGRRLSLIQPPLEQADVCQQLGVRYRDNVTPFHRVSADDDTGTYVHRQFRNAFRDVGDARELFGKRH